MDIHCCASQRVVGVVINSLKCNTRMSLGNETEKKMPDKSLASETRGMSLRSKTRHEKQGLMNEYHK